MKAALVRCDWKGCTARAECEQDAARMFRSVTVRGREFDVCTVHYDAVSLNLPGEGRAPARCSCAWQAQQALVPQQALVLQDHLAQFGAAK